MVSIWLSDVFCSFCRNEFKANTVSIILNINFANKWKLNRKLKYFKFHVNFKALLIVPKLCQDFIRKKLNVNRSIKK